MKKAIERVKANDAYVDGKGHPGLPEGFVTYTEDVDGEKIPRIGYSPDPPFTPELGRDGRYVAPEIPNECPKCGGSGVINGRPGRCSGCLGTGYVTKVDVDVVQVR
jgi:hypothetical protein